MHADDNEIDMIFYIITIYLINLQWPVDEEFFFNTMTYVIFQNQCDNITFSDLNYLIKRHLLLFKSKFLFN